MREGVVGLERAYDSLKASFDEQESHHREEVDELHERLTILIHANNSLEIAMRAGSMEMRRLHDELDRVK
jgi:hypothetical protein